MAQEFVNGKIQPGKVVVFIKPTCPYCRRAQEILSQLPIKQGLLEFVDITATNHTNEIQDYLQQLTGARTGKNKSFKAACLIPNRFLESLSVKIV
ncbi:glutaredoxin-1 isoform X2 [Papio anubis]|uniref:glutaredoxin-1 isoform X2 n=1 Tax=Papio anubis TaxID=9555 RepID=UPI000B7B2FCC|nr:glutaredoxin-1 isoform X2 [Papio anubis]XP_045249970.1 glutaredoxin-1 isoform X2 [Macaca fascicularis]XP_045249971.1 glutaredoxin-1 isoform X2 [Macaca fascicularis]